MNTQISFVGLVPQSGTSAIPDSGALAQTWTSSLIATLSGVAVTATLLTAPTVGARSILERTVPPLTRPAMLSAPAIRPPHDRPMQSTATIVRDLREKSGLTWDQLGRLLGVSRRAVHLWAAGGRINARHLELLTRLRGIVESLPAADASQRRMLLFETRQSQPSIFDVFLRLHASDEGVVTGTPFTPDQLFGARYDEAESE